MGAPQVTKSHHPNDQNISNSIIEAVAEAEGVPSTELESCLYDVIDPEALNTLFQQEEDEPATGGAVLFTFHGYRVTVHSDYSVELNQADETADEQ